MDDRAADDEIGGVGLGAGADRRWRFITGVHQFDRYTIEMGITVADDIAGRSSALR